MKARIAILGLLIALSLPLQAAEKKYQTATIADIQPKTNTKTLYYVVNTPITKDELYYQISLQMNGTLYTAQYTPKHSADTLPEEWSAGAKIDARIDGRHLYLKRPEGGEIEFVVTKHKAAAAQNSPAPVPASK